ncbi:6-hydroxymethylpterin diphosphokinase MptE-like protein [Methanogenium cariaci]|uniref:6-hydroxymethylpterin diphosphokinase MptE-like protein n=1 Tax=Methanogenium cariaci TaxID=2197 RepID=UPI000782FCF3|nr:6-hydroxymethylpterin diphosphokinase MptE-like protein [Methanogenium cariaci]
MRFEDWEPPHYLAICETFGFDPEDDETAARLLATLSSADDSVMLAKRINGETVTVCGNAPSLLSEVDTIEGTVLAADAAADVLFNTGILPDAVFTDLDGAEDSFFEMNRQGSVMVVHGHGDNVPLLRHWVPRFEGPLVLSCQTRPFGHLHNWGGFTDGDRAAFAADALGAAEVRFVGFDLDDRSVPPMKRGGKLLWARDLLSLIGHDL